MIIRVDIDGTICNTNGNEYENAVPIPENIDKINKLFDQGHNIIYWTARGSSSGKNWKLITFSQLKRWGCKFDDLEIGKPSFDLLIDDKTKRIEEI